MINRLITIIVLLILSNLALAANTDVERKTTGYGASYQEALTSALVEAVRQVRGLEVGAEKSLKTQIQVDITTGAGSTMIGKQDVSVDLYAKSKGWIKSYTVLDVREPKGEGQWAVTTMVVVPVPSSEIKNDQRKRIAVLPFRIPTRTYKVDDKSESAFQFSIQLAEQIQAQLTQSQKYIVLNRTYGQEMENEDMLLSSNQVSPEEAAKLGQKLGADYLLVGNIYSIKGEQRKFYGSSVGRIEDDVELFFALVDTATGAYITADTRSMELKRKADDSIIVSIKAIARDIDSGIFGAVYPIRILDVTDRDNIVLNRGNLPLGQQLQVQSSARELKDPDTGHVLRIAGKNLATVEVTEAKKDYSVAKLISGEIGNIKPNLMLTLISDDGKKNSEQKPLTPGSSEKPLHFD